VATTPPWLCPSISSADSDVRVSIGRALVILGQGHPDTEQIVVRDSNGLLLERELQPSYVASKPYGPDCGEVYIGSARLTLP
jgi:hypothetical protein